MSNSSLVTYRYLVSNKTNGRGGKKIEKIFVHHMAGVLTVKQCGNVFKSRPASAHYGVSGTEIGQYVDEANTAWHCGNFGWNQRSVGIELSNSTGASGGWKVSESTINTTIKLIADICKRNGIKKLNYTGNMNGNLCMHKWVASTSCPGAYLSTQFKRIEEGVNKILGAKPKDITALQNTIKASQKFFGTTADGWISGQIYAYAKYFPALADAVDSWDEEGSNFVKALQKWLKVDVDGTLGKVTITAWQKKIGMSADGVFGDKSLKAWNEYLTKNTKTTTTTPTKTTGGSTKTNTTTLYRVRKSWTDAKSQVGAYQDLTNAKKVADEKGLNVYGANGKLVYEGKKKTSTISSKTVYIGQACSDYDHKAGDSSGKEVCKSAFKYSSSSTSAYNWTYVFRPKDSAKAEKTASMCEKAIANNNIGYNKKGETAYGKAKAMTKLAKAVNYDLSKITVKCGLSCGDLICLCNHYAGLSTCYIGSGLQLANNLKKNSNFECIAYKSGMALKRGDTIITAHSSGKNNHVAMVL